MLTGVIEFANRRAPEAESPGLSAFAEAYIRRFPETSGTRLTVEECYHQIENLYQFIRSRPAETQSVQVFTPDRDTHGYSTGFSVIELVLSLIHI